MKAPRSLTAAAIVVAVGVGSTLGGLALSSHQPTSQPVVSVTDTSTCTSHLTCDLMGQGGWEFDGDVPDKAGKIHTDCIYNAAADFVVCPDGWSLAL